MFCDYNNFYILTTINKIRLIFLKKNNNNNHFDYYYYYYLFVFGKKKIYHVVLNFLGNVHM